jgi:hypothetical protein
LKQVLKIVEGLADYIALGVTGEIEKRQWINFFFIYLFRKYTICFTKEMIQSISWLLDNQLSLINKDVWQQTQAHDTRQSSESTRA